MRAPATSTWGKQCRQVQAFIFIFIFIFVDLDLDLGGPKKQVQNIATHSCLLGSGGPLSPKYCLKRGAAPGAALLKKAPDIN